MSEMLRNMARRQDDIRVPSIFELNPEEQEGLRKLVETVAEVALPLPDSLGENADDVPIPAMAGSVVSAEMIKALDDKLFGGPDKEKNERFLRAAERAKSDVEIDELAKKMKIDNDEAVAFAKSGRIGKLYREGVPPVGQVEPEPLPDLPADRIEDLDVIEGESARRAGAPPPVPEDTGRGSPVFSSGKSVDDYVSERQKSSSAPLPMADRELDVLEEAVEELELEKTPNVDAPSKKAAKETLDAVSDADLGRFGRMTKAIGKHWKKGAIPATILGLLYMMSDNEGEGLGEDKNEIRDILSGKQPVDGKKEETKPEGKPRKTRPLPRRGQRVDKTQQRLDMLYKRADEISRRLNEARGR